MKPVATIEQMRECDRITIEEYGLPGFVLMENASRAVAVKAEEMSGGKVSQKVVIVLCGKGNNGGDGFAVARHLANRGAKTRVYLAGSADSLKGDARLNYDLFIKHSEKVTEVTGQEQVSGMDWRADLIIDALLGTGFTGETSGLYRYLIEAANLASVPILSVDIPSGVNGETGVVTGTAISAASTVTFGLLKPGLLIQPGCVHTGNIETADIGIPPFVVEQQGIDIWQVEAGDAERVVPQRSADAQKWDNGYVYLISGSPGLTGACTLAAKAAMRSGAGQVIAGVPKSLNPILEVKLTEAMTEPLAESTDGYLTIESWEGVKPRLKWADAVAIGPGLGRIPKTGELLEKLIGEIDKPLIIDADGLWHLARQKELLGRLPRRTILTPHLIEMSRLTGLSPEEISADRLKTTRRMAMEWKVVVHLKGAPSITASPSGEVFINSTGNVGMATGGSGDVLTGIMAALLAGGIEPIEAAWAGSYIHGAAGDLARDAQGVRGMVAGDIVRHLHQVFDGQL